MTTDPTREGVAAPVSQQDYDEKVRELARAAGRASGRARSAADVIAGIPIYFSLWTTLDGIARDLDRTAEAFDRG